MKEDKNATVTDMTEVMLITGFDEEENMTAQELEERVNASLNDSNISSFTGMYILKRLIQSSPFKTVIDSPKC